MLIPAPAPTLPRLPSALPVPPLPPLAPSLLPTVVPLPSITAGPDGAPTVAVPLPNLPLIAPTVRVCVVLTCVDVGGAQVPQNLDQPTF